jgi:CRP/FNR family transcriptional regulator, cyclic AMP receptor protein
VLVDTPTDAQLAAVKDPSLRELASRGLLRSYPKGHVLVDEGTHGDTSYVILDGRMQVYLARKDREQQMVLTMLDAGEAVGEMAIDGHRRAASVRCLTECLVSMVTHKTLMESISARPDFAVTLLMIAIARARLATDLVRDLAFRGVYERLTRLLIQLATDQPNGELAITESLSQAQLANWIGASRDMVNRIFKALCNGGYIKVEDGKIVFPLKRLPRSF